MNGLLGALTLAFCVGIIVLVPEYGAPALLPCAVLALVALLLIKRVGSDQGFLARLFIASLLLRMLLAAGIFVFNMQDFFGGDALTYDAQGFALLQVWRGELHYEEALRNVVANNFYGMPYLVASTYALIGRNMLAVQLVNAALGALTILPIYLCAQQIFESRRVARVTALLIGFFPSMILWSAQGLKDGPIIFLLAVAMLATLRLSRKLSIHYFALLIGAMLGLLGMRFYIFYMVGAAAAGAFVIGQRSITLRSFVQHTTVIICIGLALVQFGVLHRATAQYETFGSF